MSASPLGRLKMLDLSRQLPGPFCSTVLADLGMVDGGAHAGKQVGLIGTD